MTDKDYDLVVRKWDVLVIHRPKAGAPPPGKVKLPPRLKTKRDIVEILLEERQSHR
jgi:hypothetical protein